MSWKTSVCRKKKRGSNMHKFEVLAAVVIILQAIAICMLASRKPVESRVKERDDMVEALPERKKEPVKEEPNKRLRSIVHLGADKNFRG